MPGIVIQISSDVTHFSLCQAQCPLLDQIIRITFQGGIRQSQTIQFEPFDFRRWEKTYKRNEGHLLSFPVSVFELVQFPARWSAALDVFGTSKQNDDPSIGPGTALRNYSACRPRKVHCMADDGEIRSLLRIERKPCENSCMDSQSVKMTKGALLL